MRTSFRSTLGLFGLAAFVGATAQCTQVLGLDKYKDCPGDPSCPVIPPVDTCTDQMRDGDETDADCGGSQCPARCAEGQTCIQASDCTTMACLQGKCVSSLCADGKKDGSETDIDCGGGSCPACADMKGCTNGGDCVSKVCTGGTCIPPSCNDNVENGDETDVDCGGSCKKPCAIGKTCKVNGDCFTGVCVKDSTGNLACADDFVWGKFFSGADTSYQAFDGVGTDAMGNVVVVIDRDGPLDFGGPSTFFDTVAAANVSLAKFDPTGKFIWQRDIPHQTGFQEVSSFAVNAPGNAAVLISGSGATCLANPSTCVAMPALGRLSGVDGTTGGIRPFANPARPFAAAIESGNRSIVTGELDGPYNFGNGHTAGTTDTSVFVAKFDPTTGCAWASAFPDPGNLGGTDAGQAIAIDGAGDAVVAGIIDQQIDFGSGPLSTAFIAKFSSVAGAHVWSKGFNMEPRSVTTDSSNNVLVAGVFSGMINFGGQALTSMGDNDIFVVKFSPSGSHIWSKSFGGVLADDVRQIAVDPSGNIVLTGSFHASIDFGNGPLMSAGGTDVYVAKLDPMGKYIWAKRFGQMHDEYGAGVAAPDATSVVLTGTVYDTLDLGGGPNQKAATNFLVKFLTPAAP